MLGHLLPANLQVAMSRRWRPWGNVCGAVVDSGTFDWSKAKIGIVGRVAGPITAKWLDRRMRE